MDPSTRARENQRRPRARRTELGEDLARHIRGHEAREARATLLMQKAARHVIRENARLRELLRSKDVSSHDVEEFLKEECVKERSCSAGSEGAFAGTIAPGESSRVSLSEDHADSMSCENAASIIAGMRGYSGDERARLQLGCCSSRTGKVKNVRALQIMEMD